MSRAEPGSHRGEVTPRARPATLAPFGTSSDMTLADVTGRSPDQAPRGPCRRLVVPAIFFKLLAAGDMAPVQPEVDSGNLEYP